MKVEFISKEFKSIKEVEKFQNKLYEKYNHVKIVACPCLTNNGLYQFEVK